MRFEFSAEQIQAVSGIAINIGHIFFASLVVPILYAGITPFEISPMISGSIITFTCWISGILLIKSK